MLGSARSDVCKGPGCFKLGRGSVTWRGCESGATNLEHGLPVSQKLDKARDNATFNDFFDGWILLLGKQFTELCGRVELTIGIVGEDARDHLVCKLGMCQWKMRRLG